MAYREVTMVEIKEVLLLWMGGAKKKRIAAQLTVDVKTVRRYIQAARDAGLQPGSALTDEQFGTVLQILSPAIERSHGEGWQKCESERAEIGCLLERPTAFSDPISIHGSAARIGSHQIAGGSIPIAGRSQGGGRWCGGEPG